MELNPPIPPPPKKKGKEVNGTLPQNKWLKYYIAATVLNGKKNMRLRTKK